MIKGQTFSQFKRDFYTKIPDLSVLDCGGINLLKVVLDGLFVDYVSRGSMPEFIFSSSFKWNHRLRSLKYARTSSVFCFSEGKSLLLLDSGRTKQDEQGNLVSTYFHEIHGELREESVFGTDKILGDMEYDFVFPNFENELKYKRLRKKDLLLVSNLRKVYDRICGLEVFNTKELQNIRYAFHSFFYAYKAWSEFLSSSRLKTILFICHYHKEGLVQAAKDCGIKMVELQHGIISSSDVFYNYPDRFQDVRAHAILPDYVFTYGKYWSDLLVDGNCYDRENIEEIGFTMFEQTKANSNDEVYARIVSDKRKKVLVTTQTNMSQEFKELVRIIEAHIKENSLHYSILVKTHPSEDDSLYAELISDVVSVVDLDLKLLFENSNIHVSIYSTTLFDALRFNIQQNYSYQQSNFLDYTKLIIDSGVARPFDLESVFSQEECVQESIDLTRFYSERRSVKDILKTKQLM